MKLMQWDSSLAYKAQKWANTCPDQISSIHNTTTYGENMIKLYDYNYSIPYEHAVDQWARGASINYVDNLFHYFDLQHLAK